LPEENEDSELLCIEGAVDGGIVFPLFFDVMI